MLGREYVLLVGAGLLFAVAIDLLRRCCRTDMENDLAVDKNANTVRRYSAVDDPTVNNSTTGAEETEISTEVSVDDDSAVSEAQAVEQAEQDRLRMRGRSNRRQNQMKDRFDSNSDPFAMQAKLSASSVEAQVAEDAIFEPSNDDETQVVNPNTGDALLSEANREQSNLEETSSITESSTPGDGPQHDDNDDHNDGGDDDDTHVDTENDRVGMQNQEAQNSVTAALNDTKVAPGTATEIASSLTNTPADQEDNESAAIAHSFQSASNQSAGDFENTSSDLPTETQSQLVQLESSDATNHAGDGMGRSRLFDLLSALYCGPILRCSTLCVLLCCRAITIPIAEGGDTAARRSLTLDDGVVAFALAMALLRLNQVGLASVFKSGNRLGWSPYAVVLALLVSRVQKHLSGS